jgi:phage-related protein
MSFALGQNLIHAFHKKAQRTAQQDIELAKKRYKELLQFRRENLR